MQFLTLPDGRPQVRQSFNRPLVYFDHWAVRRFSEDLPAQDRFVTALKTAGGTLLFSSANLCEFCAMNDIESGKRAEMLLARVLPNLYVADFSADPEFCPPTDVPTLHGAKAYWMASDIAERSRIAGALSVHRFVTDSITHSDTLLPIFNDMAQSIADAVNYDRQDPARREKARNFRPQPGMNAHLILHGELLRDVYIDGSAEFSANDASDFVHAVSSLLQCDFVLLDGKWCHKAEVAKRRLKKLGFTGSLARAFSAKGNGVADFLRALEVAKRPNLLSSQAPVVSYL